MTLTTGGSQAEEKVANDFIYFFKVVLDKYYLKKVCTKKPFASYCCPKASAYIKKELEAKAYAVAKAYSEVTVSVYVKGTGKSCGVGDAYAHEKAEAFLKACVKAIVAAKVGYTYSAAEYFVKGYKYMVAEAFTKAWAKACVTDGFATTYQLAFAEAISAVCVDICIKMAAYEGCTYNKTYNKSDMDVEEKEKTVAYTEGDSYVKGTGFTKGFGGAKAKTDIKGDFIEKDFIKGFP